jgi:hypothetical protein
MSDPDRLKWSRVGANAVAFRCVQPGQSWALELRRRVALARAPWSPRGGAGIDRRA